MKRFSLLLASLVLLTLVTYAQDNNGGNPNYSFRAPSYTLNTVEPNWIFNTVNDFNGNWIQIADHPVAGGLGGVSNFYWSDNDMVFVCGGVTNAASWITNAYFYNPATNTYTAKANIPTGRAYGKLVRVGSKLYYMGATNSNFSVADGVCYSYTPSTDTWALLATMPSPYMQEFATCVWHDTLIICIGGSAGAWSGTSNVRVYNVYTNTWATLGSFMTNEMSGDAECIGNEILEFGGYSGVTTQTLMYRGTVTPGSPISIGWRSAGTNPFGQGIYRTAGGLLGNRVLIGPTQNASYQAVGNIYGFLMADSTVAQYLPAGPSIANRQDLGVRVKPDSSYFYGFAGYNGSTNVSTANRYAFYNPQLPAIPFCEGFTSSTFPPTGWTITGGSANYWLRNAAVSGYGVGVGSAYYNCWNAFSGENEDFKTMTFSPTNDPGYALMFDYAYAPYPSSPPYAQDSLIVMASTNGGTSWISLLRMGPSTLQTAPAQSSQFTPTASQWARKIVALPMGTNKIDFLGKSDYGDDIYIDSVCVNFPVAIKPISNGIPKVYNLSQNYPNPFNPTTKINYSLPKAGNVELKIYDILGREVTTLVNEFKTAGSYSIEFNASNLASGVYFYRIKSGSFVDTKKMLLIK